MTDANSIPLIIRALGRGKKGSRSLSKDEASFVMQSILSQDITGPQLGAFLMLMRVKEETAEELAGMTLACHAHINYTPQQPIDVNWPAYAGKKKQPSWYILAAKLLAQQGVRILLHGGGEHTEGRQYAGAAAAFMGISTASSLAEAEQEIAEHHIAYLHLNDINPILSQLIDMKAELGLRSPVNTLVRHLNPLNANITLQGMFHPAYMPLHHDTAVLLEQNNNIVLKGDGGEFEVRPDSDTKIAINADVPCVEQAVPAALSSRSVRPESVTLQPLKDVWSGSVENPYAEAAIIQTAALVMAQKNSSSLLDAVELVTGWWQARNN